MKGKGKSKAMQQVRRLQIWTRRHIPPGLRLLVGVVLMLAGLVGFLPVIGFWMFPLGLAIAALDVVPICRALHRWWQGRRGD